MKDETELAVWIKNNNLSNAASAGLKMFEIWEWWSDVEVFITEGFEVRSHGRLLDLFLGLFLHDSVLKRC